MLADLNMDFDSRNSNIPLTEFGGSDLNVAVPKESLDRWQRITTLVAELIGVPACFVVRQVDDNLVALSGSENGAHDFIGEAYSMGQGFYCERVIESDKPLHVPDAEVDSEWDHNPDFVEDGMRGYYGLPVHWPDGSVFGTFCIFSDAKLEIVADQQKLMALLRDSLEDSLKQIFLQSTLESQNEFLRILSQTDGLTGFGNRSAFIEKGFAELRRCRDEKLPYSLIIMDIDHFKKVNDTYGHPAGDAVLQWICRRIAAHLEHQDCLGRIGGEEFGIHMPGKNESEAVQLGMRILEEIRKKPCQWDGVDISVTASMGLCQGLDGENDIKVDINLLGSIMRQADEALYRAKDAGRDRIAI